MSAADWAVSTRETTGEGRWRRLLTDLIGGVARLADARCVLRSVARVGVPWSGEVHRAVAKDGHAHGKDSHERGAEENVLNLKSHTVREMTDLRMSQE